MTVHSTLRLQGIEARLTMFNKAMTNHD